MTRAARGVALPYPETEENVVPNGRRAVSRGVARRNAKLTAPRELVTPDLAILGGGSCDGKSAAVACDHDSVVLRRRVFTGSAWWIEQILAELVAARPGFAGLVLACESARPGNRREPLAVTARAKPISDCGHSMAETVIAGVPGNMFERPTRSYGDTNPPGLLPLPPNG
jgi:hypothetical protein